MDIKLTSENMGYVIQELNKLDLTSPKRISITDWKNKRSLSANRAYQAWYPAMADELALTIPEATRYIKLMFGLPILLADEYLGPMINDGLAKKGFFELDYNSQLLEMERLPVTRLFDTEMHKRLRDDLQYYFGNLGLSLDYTKRQ